MIRVFLLLVVLPWLLPAQKSWTDETLEQYIRNSIKPKPGEITPIYADGHPSVFDKNGKPLITESGCSLPPCNPPNGDVLGKFQPGGSGSGTVSTLSAQGPKYRGYWVFKDGNSTDDKTWYLLLEHRVVAEVWLMKHDGFYHASIANSEKTQWKFDDLDTAKAETINAVTSGLIGDYCFKVNTPVAAEAVNMCPVITITDEKPPGPVTMIGDIVPLANNKGELNPLLYWRDGDILRVITPGWVALDSINFIPTH